LARVLKDRGLLRGPPIPILFSHARCLLSAPLGPFLQKSTRVSCFCRNVFGIFLFKNFEWENLVILGHVLLPNINCICEISKFAIF
jgi:hypothetical protein